MVVGIQVGLTEGALVKEIETCELDPVYIMSAYSLNNDSTGIGFHKMSLRIPSGDCCDIVKILN